MIPIEATASARHQQPAENLPAPDASPTAKKKPVLTGSRLLHTMIRVADLERSLEFYIDILGMTLLRRKVFDEQRFTLAFIGYGPEDSDAVIELTHNWDRSLYEKGDAFGHIAIAVADVHVATDALASSGVQVVRPAGPLAGDPTELIAFVLDPDGYRIELIQR